jgi:hypothetical protein
MVKPERNPPLGKSSLTRASETSQLQEPGQFAIPVVSVIETYVVYCFSASTMGSDDEAMLLLNRGCGGVAGICSIAVCCSIPVW